MAVIDPASRTPGSRARPWIALLLPPMAWIGYEYGLGTALRGACGAVGNWLGPAWGMAALLACLGAWRLGRRDAARAATEDPPARPWLARLALLGAAVFGLAIALQTLATMIVPPCAR
ncbi:MAG: hypothetical protein KGM17_00725 [Sphingomonadales bacterium]|nr:hypothetical protein [Sphingomonadales bacterium]